MTSIKDYLTEDDLENDIKYGCISIVSPDSAQKHQKILINIRGGYCSYDDTLIRVKQLSIKDKNKLDIWIGQVGYWIPICFDKTISQTTQLEHLNNEMKLKIKTKIENDKQFNTRTTALTNKIKEEQEVIKQHNLELEADEKVEEYVGEVDVEDNEEVQVMDEEKIIEEVQVMEGGEVIKEVQVMDEEKIIEEVQVMEGGEVIKEVQVMEGGKEVKFMDDIDIIDTNVIDNKTIKKLEAIDLDNTLVNDTDLDDLKWCCLSFLTPVDKNDKVYGLKIRGIFSDYDTATNYAETLQKIDIYNNIFVASMGKWLVWDPDPLTIKEQKYENESLNNIFVKKDENVNNLKILNSQEKNNINENNQKQIIDTLFE